MRKMPLARAALLFLLAGVSGLASADRLLPSDLTYVGAFAVPMTDPYAAMGAIGSTASMSFRPDGDPTGPSDGFPGSLFLSNGFYVTEINIPKPVKTTSLGSLNVAQELQSNARITGGVSLAPTDSFGAVAYVPAKGSQTTPKLYWSVFEYYNVAGDDYSSLGWGEVKLSAPTPAGIWHIGTAAGTNWDSAFHGQKYGDYIIPVDQAWADQNTGGKSLLVGRYREAGAAGGSMGPVLTAVAPWAAGNPPGAGSTIPALPLMYFNTISQHTDDTTWMQFQIPTDPDYIYYSAGDRWHGGAWVASGTKKAVLIVGRHGTYNGKNPCPPTASGDGCHGTIGSTTPPYCYGVGGVDCPYGIAATNDKGYHTGPYKPRFLFVDPDDLAQVAAGKKAANAVTAYAMYDPTGDWPWKDSDNFNDVDGAAYDSSTGYLYVVQGNANRPGGGSSTPWPVIQVYKVGSGTGTPAPALPNPPSNVTVQ